MLTDGIDTLAPKLSLKKAIIYFLPRNITKEMHMGHLRPMFIGEALARMLEYSGVVVLPKGIHDWDHLDVNHLEIQVHAVGPKHAGLAVKDNIMGPEYKDMMERCVVCGPGFVKFKLSRKWIAKSISKMLTDAKFPSSPVYSLAPFSSNSSVGRLTERRKSGAHTTSSMADSDDDDNRWSLQEEIEKVFNTSLERTFNLKEAGSSCSISTCTKEDDGDYLCMRENWAGTANTDRIRFILPGLRKAKELVSERTT
nr:aminoacyl-tRNA synthetase, class 1a, anticodon-binding [Tanacetum cinerariifolium]